MEDSGEEGTKIAFSFSSNMLFRSLVVGMFALIVLLVSLLWNSINAQFTDLKTDGKEHSTRLNGVEQRLTAVETALKLQTR